jgi:hypothetical protein
MIVINASEMEYATLDMFRNGSSFSYLCTIAL